MEPIIKGDDTAPELAMTTLKVKDEDTLSNNSHESEIHNAINADKGAITLSIYDDKNK